MINRSRKLGVFAISAVCVIGTGIVLFNNANEEIEVAAKKPSVESVSISPEEFQEIKDATDTIYTSDYYYKLTVQTTNDLPPEQIAHGVQNINENTILIIDEDGKTYIRSAKAE